MMDASFNPCLFNECPARAHGDQDLGLEWPLFPNQVIHVIIFQTLKSVAQLKLYAELHRFDDNAIG